jgi:hypothetical protein
MYKILIAVLLLSGITWGQSTAVTGQLYEFAMHKRVAIGAKVFQITDSVIARIFVYMMNMQNFREVGIPTPITYFWYPRNSENFFSPFRLSTSSSVLTSFRTIFKSISVHFIGKLVTPTDNTGDLYFLRQKEESLTSIGAESLISAISDRSRKYFTAVFTRQIEIFSRPASVWSYPIFYFPLFNTGQRTEFTIRVLIP